MASENIEFTILAADDNPVNQLIMKEILSRHYNVLLAGDGQETLDIINSKEIDLILLDIMMPLIDGFDVCIQLKKQEETKEIPVIFITAKADNQSIIKGLELGAVDYITKPFNKIELLARVKNHIDLVKSKKQLQKELTEKTKAQQALKEREEKLRTITDNITDIITKTDPNGIIQYATPSYKHLLGYTPDELIGKSVFEIIPDNEQEWLQKAFQNGVENKQSAVVRHKCKHKFGDILWLETRGSIVCNNDNEVVSIILGASDITDEKMAEDQIKQNLKEQQLLAQISSNLLKSYDFDSKINDTIQAIGDSTQINKISIYENYQNSANLVYDWSKNINSADIYELNIINFNKHAEFKQKLLSKKQFSFYNSETTAFPLLKQNLLIDIKAALILPLFVQNRFFGIILFGTKDENKWDNNDIELFKTVTNILSNTYEIKIFNLELTKQETQLRSIFDNSGDAIIVTNKKGQIISANNKTAEYLESNRNEIKKKNIIDIIYKTEKQLINKILNKLKNINETTKIESKIVSSSGKVIPIEATISFINIGNEDVFLGIIRDITERKQIEQTIINTILKTEEKERTRFAKDLHDGMGALLSSINIYLNMMLTGEMNQAELENTLIYTKGLVDEAITGAKEIANNIMPTILDRFGLVNSIKSFIEKIENIKKHKITFNHQNYNDIKNKDKELILFRMINELFNNTFKHAEANIIKLELSTDCENILLNYQDNGKGFDLNAIKKSKISGMGVNNIISRTKSLNGKCDINTQLNKGTKIKIEIPIHNY